MRSPLCVMLAALLASCSSPIANLYDKQPIVNSFLDVGTTIPSSGDGWHYDSGSQIYYIEKSGSYIIVGDNADALNAGETPYTRRVVVQSGVKATITLYSVRIDVDPLGTNIDVCAFDMSGADVTMLLSGNNYLTSAGGAAGLQLNCGTLVIDSTVSGSTDGWLIAKSNSNAYTYGAGAGIGSHDQTSTVGTIIIKGGTITAEGGYYNDPPPAINPDHFAGAGIGGGDRSIGFDVIIEGGKVTALGGASATAIGMGAAGIGGGIDSSESGYDNPHTKTIISGGTVIAVGGPGAAGIGGGYGYTGVGNAGAVEISGGFVTAVGGKCMTDWGGAGAGIGGGGAGGGSAGGGNSGTIKISGGTVIALGSSDGTAHAAAIGSGASVTNSNWSLLDSDLISITGGTVIAYADGVGIGDSTSGGVTSITIESQAVVFASAITNYGGPQDGVAIEGSGLTSSGLSLTWTPPTSSTPPSLTGTITLNNNFTVPAGGVLSVPKGWNLDLASSSTLINNGTINHGNLTVPASTASGWGGTVEADDNLYGSIINY